MSVLVPYHLTNAARFIVAPQRLYANEKPSVNSVMPPQPDLGFSRSIPVEQLPAFFTFVFVIFRMKRRLIAPVHRLGGRQSGSSRAISYSEIPSTHQGLAHQASAGIASITRLTLLSEAVSARGCSLSTISSMPRHPLLDSTARCPTRLID